MKSENKKNLPYVFAFSDDGKSFEFNFPITVASRIASAIEIIMKNNEN